MHNSRQKIQYVDNIEYIHIEKDNISDLSSSTSTVHLYEFSFNQRAYVETCMNSHPILYEFPSINLSDQIHGALETDQNTNFNY